MLSLNIKISNKIAKMWNNNAPPIPFRPGGPTAPSQFGVPPGAFGGRPGGFPGRPGHHAPMGMGNTTAMPAPMSNMSNFGMMTFGVSQNMQTQYIQHISKLEPLIIAEMKKSKFRGSITNMAKLMPPKRELSIVIDTIIDITGQKIPVRL